MNLTGKNNLMNLLSGYGFSFSKSLGQNFLIDKNILETIIENSGVDENSNVIEIGPGAGTLTNELCKIAKKVVSIEIDKTLKPVLSKVLGEYSNFKLISDDVMNVDMSEIVKNEFCGEPFIVVANLPYYITTPIVMSFLEGDLPIKCLTLMIQKEVGNRIIAEPGGKEYGALSVAVQYYCEPSIVCTAPPHCFVPQPKVTSTVIKLDVYDEPPYKPTNKEYFFKVVKSLFSQRRKTLVNSLFKSPYMVIDKNNVIKVLEDMDIRADIRGEKLGIETLVEFSNMLYALEN